MSDEVVPRRRQFGEAFIILPLDEKLNELVEVTEIPRW